MWNFANALVRDESGQDLIEYALLVAALAMTVAAIVPYNLVPLMSDLNSKLVATLTAS